MNIRFLNLIVRLAIVLFSIPLLSCHGTNDMLADSESTTSMNTAGLRILALGD